jgi:hypothetical protein
MTFAFVNPIWDDYCTTEELPDTLRDLIAAGLPFTITALPQQHHEPEAPADGIECLTAAERNPSLCR